VERLLSTLPAAFPSLGCTAPAPSLPSQGGVLSLGPFSWPCSGHTAAAPCLSCTEVSTSGCSTPGDVSPVHSRDARITSLTLLATLLLMQPIIWLAFWAVRAHWFMSSCQYPPNHFQQGCVLSLCPPAGTDSRNCCGPGVDLVLGFVEPDLCLQWDGHSSPSSHLPSFLLQGCV